MASLRQSPPLAKQGCGAAQERQWRRQGDATSAQNKAAEQCSGDAKANPVKKEPSRRIPTRKCRRQYTEHWSGNCVAKTEPDEGRSDEEGINEEVKEAIHKALGGTARFPEQGQREKALSGGLGTQDAGVEVSVNRTPKGRVVGHTGRRS
eukprot:gene10855-16969_t